jgi:para-aminobenzoate synthetase component I
VLRFTKKIKLENPIIFQQKMLQWAQQFREIVFLDSNRSENLNQKYQTFDAVLAVDAFTSIQTDFTNAFDDLKQYQQTTNDWIFGYLSYDLKNDLEDLVSENDDEIEFPELFFFQPKKLFFIVDDILEIQYLNCCDDELDFDFLEIQKTTIFEAIKKAEIKINQQYSKETYIEKVIQLKNHISRGDVYEANFCFAFFSENIELQPLDVFNKLNKISKAPFSAYFKNNKHFLMCASPERYLKKQADFVVSQPIKGTAKRFENEIDDLNSKNELSKSLKERSENIMITDLVRNDLSVTATKGSVQVEELCKVYSFKQVHQMISTITSSLKTNFSVIDLLKTTFPMGSMTGAPKVSAMRIIENLEQTKRGIYSGAIGYFSPNNDFDFNVVIRSVLYNQDKKYLSFLVGSAITSLSIPEQEFEECLLKAKAMLEVM